MRKRVGKNMGVEEGMRGGKGVVIGSKKILEGGCRV